MEDAEEIERFYEKEMERIDREFLKNIKETKDRKRLGKEYKKNLSKLRSEYQKKYEKYLKNRKNKKTKKKYEKEEKTKQFKVTPLNLKKTRREKFQLKYEPFKFRFKIKIRSFFRKITPQFLTILYLKTKLNTKRGFRFTKEFIKELFSKTKEKIILSAGKTGLTTKKVYIKIRNSISSTLKRIINKIKPKKKESKEGKTEDQKLAEKILAKKD